MALLLGVGDDDPELLDLHGGQDDLASRQLNFLHVGSVQDDPTRVVRGARYAARLGFGLAPQALEQVQATVEAWPWPWRHGDALDGVPPALGTRLRMEMELMFGREPWRQAVGHLQAWEAFPCWIHRCRTIACCCGVCTGPSGWVFLCSASWWQLPRRLWLWLSGCSCLYSTNVGLRSGWVSVLVGGAVLPDSWQGWSAARWTEALETRPWSAEVVALEAALMGPCWRPLLRWWGRWRHVKPLQTASDLMATGLRPGPQLGEALRRSRLQRLEAMR